jgi:hypothetical protein
MCRVCGAVEDELPTDCPGYRINEYQLQDVATGAADFRDGRWIYASMEAGAVPVGLRQSPPGYADGPVSNGEDATPKVRNPVASGRVAGIGAKFLDWVKSLIDRGT